MVLCKHVDESGFRFFTNYESKKAADLSHTPRAALVFYWASLHRSVCAPFNGAAAHKPAQVRVSGLVSKVGDDESAKYFAVRPRGSQLGAWASRQRCAGGTVHGR